MIGKGSEGVSVECWIVAVCVGMVGGTPPQVPFGGLGTTLTLWQAQGRLSSGATRDDMGLGPMHAI